jgi:predicted DsbA family dithiol-disulfide isomerase
MANRLFESESLAPERLLELAQAEGLELSRFGECLTAEETTQRLEAESALFTQIALRGLPSTYIGDELVVGAQPREVLEAAFERAATGARKPSVGPVAFASLSLLIALALWAVPPRRRSA